MATYKVLIDTVIKRELGILGKERMWMVLADLRLPASEDGRCLKANCSIDDLDHLMQELSARYGAVAVMGCKIAVGRLAREAGLELPKILK
ncbi:MAG: hypothetical protein HZA03_06180 [Nitrospinae bacterium]|nr:hypothetical protein [Nitrospinota bacterium]